MEDAWETVSVVASGGDSNRTERFSINSLRNGGEKHNEGQNTKRRFETVILLMSACRAYRKQVGLAPFIEYTQRKKAKTYRMI